MQPVREGVDFGNTRHPAGSNETLACLKLLPKKGLCEVINYMPSYSCKTLLQTSLMRCKIMILLPDHLNKANAVI